MPKNFIPFVTACFVILLTECCFSESVFVELSDVPADGFVVCPLDMTPAANWLETPHFDGAEFYLDERKLDATFVPGPGDHPMRGTFVAVIPDDVPRGKPVRLRLLESSSEMAAGNGAQRSDRMERETVLSPKPEALSMESLKWHDRLHDPETGSWDIVNDKDATVELLADTSFLKVIRTTTAFQRADGTSPQSQPKAIYDWFVFPERELIYVIVFAQQNEPTEWKEKHFLELHIPDGSFGKWFGDDKSGTFTGTKQSTTFSRYAGFLDDSNNVIAAIAPGTVVYDGLNDFGPYLLPRGNEAWQAWSDTKHRATTWYWIGNSEEPNKTLQAAYETVRNMPRAEIVIPELEDTAWDWSVIALDDLFLSGKITSKTEFEHMRKALDADRPQLSKILPTHWFSYKTMDSGMILEIANDQGKGKGLRLLSLVNDRTGAILSARNPVPLFTAEVFDKETGKTFTLTSDNGWGDVRHDGAWSFLLSNPTELPGAKTLEITLSCYTDSALTWYDGFAWIWSVSQEVDRYEFRKASVGQIALRNLGPKMKAFYPHVSGVVTENPVGKELHWRGTYPSGWCSMQYTAVYDEIKTFCLDCLDVPININTGLYVAANNGGGSVKEIRLDADSASDSLTIRLECPLPLDGTSKPYINTVWRVFEGDWYDAACIYRMDVRSLAEWYPRTKLGPDGRTDTPQWMKELCVWAQCGDSPETMPELMRKFTEAFGIPMAVHWYNWHQIPFDNDYPHYFPAKDGFKEAVAEIQKNGDCFVMPYINGHLWDTRDKGMEDFQFSSVALPGTAKKEDGTPWIETYGSKEADGSPVELAAMCPASDIWKSKVAENIFRLINDYGVAGVYVDQVAAAQPNLCFDPTHGHPLAGGDWWCRAYWDMFEKIRAEMPKDKMLTTECNAEPYVNIFDGYLTWHFQYQDQVPAFAAVYGGAVQMFGRAYRGGPSQVLADRMKAAQQLVYGEQIGWFDPRIVDDPVRFPFVREIVQTRYKYRDYFYKGEMIRPPKLLDDIPTVTADWQWYGETIITTDAVSTGAWRKMDAKGETTSAVFFFVNVSDEPITSRVEARFDEIGLESKAFDEPLTFEPGVPLAIEVVPP